MLASGGGSEDKTLKIWSLQRGEAIAEKQTGSQICSLAYSQRTNDVVTGHGLSRNEINFWKGNDFQKLGTILNHQNRVLYLGFCEQGNTLVSVGADETVRFWTAYSPDDEEESIDSPVIRRRLITDFSGLR